MKSLTINILTAVVLTVTLIAPVTVSAKPCNDQQNAKLLKLNGLVNRVGSRFHNYKTLSRVDQKDTINALNLIRSRMDTHVCDSPIKKIAIGAMRDIVSG